MKMIQSFWTDMPSVHVAVHEYQSAQYDRLTVETDRGQFVSWVDVILLKQTQLVCGAVWPSDCWSSAVQFDSHIFETDMAGVRCSMTIHSLEADQASVSCSMIIILLKQTRPVCIAVWPSILLKQTRASADVLMQYGHHTVETDLAGLWCSITRTVEADYGFCRREFEGGLGQILPWYIVNVGRIGTLFTFHKMCTTNTGMFRYNKLILAKFCPSRGFYPRTSSRCQFLWNFMKR